MLPCESRGTIAWVNWILRTPTCVRAFDFLIIAVLKSVGGSHAQAQRESGNIASQTIDAGTSPPINPPSFKVEPPVGMLATPVVLKLPQM